MGLRTNKVRQSRPRLEGSETEPDVQPATGGSNEQPAKRKRAKFIRLVVCKVCGDMANDHSHYGAQCCYSCKFKVQLLNHPWPHLMCP